MKKKTSMVIIGSRTNCVQCHFTCVCSGHIGSLYL